MDGTAVMSDDNCEVTSQVYDPDEIGLDKEFNIDGLSSGAIQSNDDSATSLPNSLSDSSDDEAIQSAGVPSVSRGEWTSVNFLQKVMASVSTRK